MTTQSETVWIKKDEGSIDEVLGQYRGQKVESVSDAVQEGCPRVEVVVDKVGEVLRAGKLDKKIELCHKIDDILSPAELKGLLLDANLRFGKYKTFVKDMGSILAYLVQRSYKAGNNGFYFQTHELEQLYSFNTFNYNLSEPPGGKPIVINIEGNVGHLFADGSSHVVATVSGNAGNSIGAHTKNCRFHVKSNAANALGIGAEDSVFYVEGEVGEFDLANHARGCTFKTRNGISLYRFRCSVPKGNRIILVHKDGHEEMWQDYDSHK